ncbi:hypothetical protein M413DRAFT_447618 [Hebeloma cylindrosporum]|uniref:Uncharacterized protein n=1 Tax=Hebeloma cylindrosporum TaxID=76867 RepID=A0A0C3BPU4_HEBCY|nr:hypothetical protein M413DRAFT_447618 [Hebeloma cylindrosporum h7]
MPVNPQLRRSKKCYDEEHDTHYPKSVVGRDRGTGERPTMHRASKSNMKATIWRNARSTQYTRVLHNVQRRSSVRPSTLDN